MRCPHTSSNSRVSSAANKSNVAYCMRLSNTMTQQFMEPIRALVAWLNHTTTITNTPLSQICLGNSSIYSTHTQPHSKCNSHTKYRPHRLVSPSVVFLWTPASMGERYMTSTSSTSSATTMHHEASSSSTRVLPNNAQAINSN